MDEEALRGSEIYYRTYGHLDREWREQLVEETYRKQEAASADPPPKPAAELIGEEWAEIEETTRKGWKLGRRRKD